MNPIRTPIELDAASRALDRDLDSLYRSPRLQFFHILEFSERCSGLPDAWTRSYFLPLLQRITVLLHHPYLRNCPPSAWRTCSDIARREDLRGVLNVDITAFDRAWRASVQDHAQVGALRTLHATLLRYRKTETRVSDEQWAEVFSSGPSEYDCFVAYARLVQADDPIAELLELVRAEWEALRGRMQSVAIALIDHDTPEHPHSGVILHLDVDAVSSRTGGLHFDGALGGEGGLTHEQLEVAQRWAHDFLRNLFGTAVPAFELRYRVRDYMPVFVGGSLGAAAAAGAVAAMSCRLNGPVQWQVPATTAIIGGIDERGRLQPGPWSVVESKLRACFFSPIENVIVPAAHREKGQELLQTLRNEYPARTLQIFGAQSVADCLRYGAAVREVRRSAGQRLAAFARDHSVFLWLSAIALLLGVAGGLAWKAWYVYPDLETTLGLKVRMSAIVYNPRAPEEWCFRDDTARRAPLVPFGDLEVGDGFTRDFWVWNMTPHDRDIVLTVEGSDSGDWYINWNPGRQTLPSTKPLRMSVMFAPLTPGEGKRAALVLRDASSGDELYRLSFTGAAGAGTPAGYALHLDGEDDGMYFGASEKAFDSEEGTFECWVRPDKERPNPILYNGVNPPDGAALSGMLFEWYSPDTLGLSLAGTTYSIPLPREQRLKPGQWRHVAVAWSHVRRSIEICLDGQSVWSHHGELYLESAGSPHVSIGMQYNGQKTYTRYCGAIDELRLWEQFRSPAEIRSTMHITLPEGTPRLAGCWNFDQDIDITAFSTGGAAHNAELRGRPQLQRSFVPLHPSALGDRFNATAGRVTGAGRGAGTDPDAWQADCRLVPGPDAALALALQPYRYLSCIRPLLPRTGNATWSLWFRSTVDGTTAYFSVSNLDQYYRIGGDLYWLPGHSAAILRTIRPGWNHVVIRQHSDGTNDVFLNGEAVRRAAPASFPVDRLYRYEGIQVGFFNDRYNQFGPKQYPMNKNLLATERAFSSLQFWSRALADAEISALSDTGAVIRNGLVAWWPLDALPDENGLLRDRISGALMIVKRVRGWE